MEHDLPLHVPERVGVVGAGQMGSGIAAFTDDDHDLEIADLLTQEQAESVRKYLVEKHGIDSAGWFRSRKVAAIGFGTQVPRLQEEPAGVLPPRRVDIILFTPQT